MYVITLKKTDFYPVCGPSKSPPLSQKRTFAILCGSEVWEREREKS